jgi:5S rRNA maturation endonuclease (ribonuclease M5)
MPAHHTPNSSKGNKDLSSLMEPVARRLLEEPNKAFSSNTELRYGNKGSLAIDLTKGTFFDHENNEGGGVLDLIRRVVQGTDPIKWLIAEGFIDEEPRRKNKEYVYKDETGKPYVRKTRNLGDGPPFWWHQSVNGKWIPKRDQNTAKILYRLPEVIAAIKKGITIFVVEGEKDVDNVAALGLCATCSPDGAAGEGARNPKWYDLCTEQLRGADIVVLNDNDKPGRAHATVTCNELNGKAKRVRWLDINALWPSCPDKGDISDWLEQGGTKQEFLDALDVVPDWKPEYNGSAIHSPLSKIVLTNKEFLATFTTPEYLIDGLLQRRYLYSLTGATGHGKTCVVLRIAAHVLMGMRLNNMDVEKGKVLYFAGENPDDVLARWIKTCDEMNIPDDIEMHWIRGTPPMTVAEIKSKIVNEAKDHGPFSLIIVDTSAAYFKGDDENSNKDLGDHARMLRGLVDLHGGPTILVTCHPVKHADHTNLLPRGGGAFLAEVDGNLVAILNNTLIEIDTQGKFRGPEFAPFAFKLQPGKCERLRDTKGRMIWTITAVPVTEQERVDIEDSMEAKQEELIILMKDKPGLSFMEYARALGWQSSNGEPNKRLVQRIMDRMVRDHMVEKVRGKYELKKKGETWMNKGRNGTMKHEPPQGDMSF